MWSLTLHNCLVSGKMMADGKTECQEVGERQKERGRDTNWWNGGIWTEECTLLHESAVCCILNPYIIARWNATLTKWLWRNGSMMEMKVLLGIFLLTHQKNTFPINPLYFFLNYCVFWLFTCCDYYKGHGDWFYFYFFYFSDINSDLCDKKWFGLFSIIKSIRWIMVITIRMDSNSFKRTVKYKTEDRKCLLSLAWRLKQRETRFHPDPRAKLNTRLEIKIHLDILKRNIIESW